ncbi:retrovirus-related Pol polyprotein from transposon 297 [Trichonephila clavipes]|nr:retrovirus-related Pol polyprotein from transposon 297 [Trichonephila clavipes]
MREANLGLFEREITKPNPGRSDKFDGESIGVVWCEGSLRRNRYVLVITHHFSKWAEITPLKKASAKPQVNRTERVNHDLVQMIANYVNDQHHSWDHFLGEFAYAIRTAVNKTTGKTPAELFLGRKLITSFQKFVMVSDGTEFAVGDNEKWFDEARKILRINTKSGRRRDSQIKVHDWILVKTHPLSSAAQKVVAKFEPKFEGPYGELKVKRNN